MKLFKVMATVGLCALSTSAFATQTVKFSCSAARVVVPGLESVIYDFEVVTSFGSEGLVAARDAKISVSKAVKQTPPLYYLKNAKAEVTRHSPGFFFAYNVPAAKDLNVEFSYGGGETGNAAPSFSVIRHGNNKTLVSGECSAIEI